eukprot:6597544-Ditylum_brightwellii.AAC.1
MKDGSHPQNDDSTKLTSDHTSDVSLQCDITILPESSSSSSFSMEDDNDDNNDYSDYYDDEEEDDDENGSDDRMYQFLPRQSLLPCGYENVIVLPFSPTPDEEDEDEDEEGQKTMIEEYTREQWTQFCKNWIYNIV